MIRKHIDSTKSATFAILLPSANHKGMPVPNGTGFFVSGDGWFITAAHVINQNSQLGGTVRDDDKLWELEKEFTPGGLTPSCKHVSLAGC